MAEPCIVLPGPRRAGKCAQLSVTGTGGGKPELAALRTLPSKGTHPALGPDSFLDFFPAPFPGEGSLGRLASNNLAQREEGVAVQHFPPCPAALLYPGLGPFFVASSLPGWSWAELPREGFVLPGGLRSCPLMHCSHPNAPPFLLHTSSPLSLIFNCCSCFL